MDIPIALPGMEGQNLALRIGTFSGPKLMLAGQQVAKQNGAFQLRSNTGTTIAIKFKPRFLDPIPNLQVGGQTIQLTPPLAWYQYAWMAIPIVLVFVGGLIGGLCGGLAAGISSRIFRSQNSEGVKYALTGLVSLGAFVTYFMVAGTIMAAIRK
ncbi:MAG TPA: hypothetical protein VG498_08360 [Terriglobales bacterium]|nr:hypothetical protein [Terriglobales bacterium]